MISDNAILADEVNGGEYRFEHGQEKVALWLPLSRAQKTQLIERMIAKNVTRTDLVMTAIKDFS